MTDKGLRFGIVTAQVDVSWAKMVERWRYIEQLGFDSVWLADEFVYFTPPTKPWFEAWTLLAALATQTSRIRIGTLVTATPFRNPAFLARQALTVEDSFFLKKRDGTANTINRRIPDID